MTREEAIKWLKRIKECHIREYEYDSRGTLGSNVSALLQINEALDMAISALQAEPSEYVCWLESIIVTDEPCWLCEDSIDDEWCDENCGKSSIQAECLRHFFKVLSAETHEIRTETHECAKETHDSDLISRADAIEAVQDVDTRESVNVSEAVKAINALPCKTCGYYNLECPKDCEYSRPSADAVSREDYEDIIKDYRKQYENMNNEIADLEAKLAEAEWIPCSERLPSESGWYLVTVQGYETVTDVSLYSADGSAWGDVSTKQKVTAWTPLPKPYREGGE